MAVCLPQALRLSLTVPWGTHGALPQARVSLEMLRLSLTVPKRLTASLPQARMYLGFAGLRVMEERLNMIQHCETFPLSLRLYLEMYD